MALWGKHDNLASAPKYVARITLFNSATAVDTSAETIDLRSSNTDFAKGDAVVYGAAGGTAIGGLTDGGTYYVGLTATSGVINLYDTQAHADAGGSTGKVNLTAVGSGTQSLQRTGVANTNDHNYNGRTLYFADINEAQQAENRARGLKTPGWVEYVSYTAADGSVRHKSEILVALTGNETSGATGSYNIQANTGDNTADDSVLVDATTSITVQPVNRSVTHPAGTTFSVTSTATGAYSSLTYQWQISSDGGSTWTNLSNAGVYSGVNTNTLTISNSTGLNGKKYHVICGTDTANTNAISNAVTLTVA